MSTFEERVTKAVSEKMNAETVQGGVKNNVYK